MNRQKVKLFSRKLECSFGRILCGVFMFHQSHLELFHCFIERMLIGVYYLVVVGRQVATCEECLIKLQCFTNGSVVH